MDTLIKITSDEEETTMLVWFTKHDGFVTARLVDIVDRDLPATEVSANGIRWFRVTLQDRDHASLIDTLNKIWPNWKDGDITARRQMEAA